MKSTTVEYTAGSNLRASLTAAGILVFLLLLVVTLYTLAHEGGHALVGILLGGKINAFSVNFFNLSAHVSIDGDFTMAQHAWISAAGVSLPILLCMAFLLLAPRSGNVVFLWFKTIFFLSSINALLAWMVIPILVGMGNIIGDDSANFMGYTRLAPWQISIAALLVYLGGWFVFLKQVGGISNLIAQIRPPAHAFFLPETRKRVNGLVAFGVVVMALGLSLTLAFPDNAFKPPAGYQLGAELDLSAQKYEDQVVYSFDLSQPSKMGFYILLTNVKGSPVKVELVGPDGYSNVLFANNESRFDAGRASINPEGLMLASGSYQMRVTFQQSQGKVQIFTWIE